MRVGVDGPVPRHLLPDTAVIDTRTGRLSVGGADLLDPVLNLPLKSNGANAWFGWPNDEKLEALRVQWLKATTLDERKKLAAAIFHHRGS